MDTTLNILGCSLHEYTLTLLAIVYEIQDFATVDLS